MTKGVSMFKLSFHGIAMIHNFEPPPPLKNVSIKYR